VLNALAPTVPALIGGSADLSGSNNTVLEGSPAIARGKFDGRNLNFGVREHGMAAIANGLCLHGGLRPYVATFLVFSDYMRPAVRLAALMHQPVVFVFTHDSIFVGEDGPTHQPVEQAAALRAIPHLEVWRPADARETRSAWLAALRRSDGPSALLLTRQAVPVLEAESVESDALRGGYVALRESGPRPELVLVATGSEVSICCEAARVLAAEGRSVRVVSVPCLERFLALAPDERDAVLAPAAPRLVVEAGVPLGMAPLLRPGDRFHGMERFGASAPWKHLAEHFGFTTGAVAGLARELLPGR
jgi:transketolase